MNNPTFTALIATIYSLIKSHDKGIDASQGIVDHLSIDSITVKGVPSFDFDGAKLTFNSQAHFLSYVMKLLYTVHKDKNHAQRVKLFNHISTGALSLTHDVNGTISIDKYARFQDLFGTLGVSKVESNGKGSKLTRLHCLVSTEAIASLGSNGFTHIAPFIEGLAIGGLLVMLPAMEG